jgi:hypothetical protein
MADRELIASTLTAGLLSPVQKGKEDEAIQDAITLYQQVIAALQKRLPTDQEADRNAKVLHRMAEWEKP